MRRQGSVEISHMLHLLGTQHFVQLHHLELVQLDELVSEFTANLEAHVQCFRACHACFREGTAESASGERHNFVNDAHHLGSDVEHLLKRLLGLVPDLLRSLADFFGKSFDLGRSLLRDLLDSGSGFLKSLLNALTSLFKSFLDTLAGFLEGVANLLEDVQLLERHVGRVEAQDVIDLVVAQDVAVVRVVDDRVHILEEIVFIIVDHNLVGSHTMERMSQVHRVMAHVVIRLVHIKMFVKQVAHVVINNMRVCEQHIMMDRHIMHIRMHGDINVVNWQHL